MLLIKVFNLQRVEIDRSQLHVTGIVPNILSAVRIFWERITINDGIQKWILGAHAEDLPHS